MFIIHFLKFNERTRNMPRVLPSTLVFLIEKANLILVHPNTKEEYFTCRIYVLCSYLKIFKNSRNAFVQSKGDEKRDVILGLYFW